MAFPERRGPTGTGTTAVRAARSQQELGRVPATTAKCSAGRRQVLGQTPLKEYSPTDDDEWPGLDTMRRRGRGGGGWSGPGGPVTLNSSPPMSASAWRHRATAPAVQSHPAASHSCAQKARLPPELSIGTPTTSRVAPSRPRLPQRRPISAPRLKQSQHLGGTTGGAKTTCLAYLVLRSNMLSGATAPLISGNLALGYQQLRAKVRPNPQATSRRRQFWLIWVFRRAILIVWRPLMGDCFSASGRTDVRAYTKAALPHLNKRCLCC